MKQKRKRLLGILLAVTMVLSLFPMAVSAAGTDAVINGLKVNNLTQPLGVDTNPTFRWKVAMDGFGKAQSAYRLIVSSTKEKANAHEGDLWDSGKVAGSNNFDIAYAGAALSSRTPYYWAVQLWDEQDQSVGWSDTAAFETGVLEQQEWTARWITSTQLETVSMDFRLRNANWIWSRYGAAQDGVPAETMYFRNTFQVDPAKTVQGVYLGFTTDDYGTVYLNGVAAGTVENVANAWQGGSLSDVTQLIHGGTNTVAANVTNGNAGYAGFIAKIEVRYTDGTTDTVVTDSSWKLTRNPQSGWETVEFDDSGWETPDQVLPYGTSPWGESVSLPAQIQGEEIFSAPMLRKQFDLEKPVKRARAYVSGLGLFEMKINGTLPDDTVLNPAHTQYEDTVNYRVFDVTALLQQGSNAVTAEVGNSFYNCIINTWSWPDAVWRDFSKFMMELVIEYEDGTKQTIVTDESWKAYAHGPVVENDIYTGETYDARKEVVGWETAEFDDSGWDNAVLEDAPAGKLTFENMEPMRRLKTFRPEVINKGDGVYVLKNPEMTTGWAKIAFDAPAGTEVTITYGEQLNSSGYLSKVSLEGHVLQSDVYICKGEPGETYEPKFSYKGYEYIQIDNYPGELTAEDVECYLIANDVEITASLDTSSELINSLHEIMQRTMRNNMQGKPTDTPVWEKNGWTGDFNVSLHSFNYNFDMPAFTEKFLGDLRDSASSRGTIPNISPTANWGMDNSPVWNTVYINALYENWKSNGQFSVIEDHYEAMRKQAQAYIDDIRYYGWVWSPYYLADWVAPDGDASASEGSGICATAYVYRALERMAEIADVMGKTEDAAVYRDAMANIYTAFNKAFYNAEKGYYETTYWSDATGQRTRYRQTSNLVPLAFGLCPEEYRQSVVDSLLTHIVDVKGVHLDTGMVGTELLLPVLSQMGQDDLALAVLTQTTYPSWGYWLTENNTTSTWEGYGTNARSRNHYFLGTYEEWIFAYLAGIRDAENGYETVTIDPYVNGQLAYVDCSVDTVRGTLRSSWQVGETVTLEVTIPTGTTATIHLPAASAAGVSVNGGTLQAQAGISNVNVEEGEVVVTAGSGSYTFVMGTEKLGVTKIALQQVISDVKRMNRDYYTDTVWENLLQVLKQAETLLDTPDVGQDELDAMADRLKAAVEEAELQRSGNLALGKSVTVSSTVDNGSWTQGKLTDGVTGGTVASEQVLGWTSDSNREIDHEEWAMVDLGRMYRIARVNLYPAGQRGTVGAVSYGFPRDFVIEISEDRETWTPVVSETGYEPPVMVEENENPVQKFQFAEITARYVRVRATSLNQLVHDGNRYRMQLAELEVYSNQIDKSSLKTCIAKAEQMDSTLYPAGAWTRMQAVLKRAKALAADQTATQEALDAMEQELTAAIRKLQDSLTANVALNKPVSVSSSLDQGVGTAWHQKNLTDGDQKNKNAWEQYGGWTSNDNIYESHEEWAMVDLQDIYRIYRLDLYPGGYYIDVGRTIYGFPKDFVIETSTDGQIWSTALTVTDYPAITLESATELPVQRFTFDTVEARYVRVRATALHALVNDGYTYRMQLAEFEVYNAAEDPEDAAAAVDELIAAIGQVTADSRAAVAQAREAYDSLSDEEKALVTRLAELTAAEYYFKTLDTQVELVLTGSDKIYLSDTEAVYTLRGENMVNLANLILTLDISEQTLTEPEVEAAAGWQIIASSWENGKLWLVLGNYEGADGDGELLKLTLKPTGETGEADVRISEAVLSAYLGSGETYVTALLERANATTQIRYSRYDVNRDGAVNLLDLARAQRYYGEANEICDVNSDGQVDINDLILILNHSED